MSANDHYRRLERLYGLAPINEYFSPRLTVREGEADVRIEVRRDFFHAASALHGAVYFKILDDSAFFAVASLVTDVFVLTKTMTVKFTKPVTGGVLVATGRVTGRDGHRYTAESNAVDESGAIVGSVTGVFVCSTIPLSTVPGYADTPSRAP